MGFSETVTVSLIKLFLHPQRTVSSTPSVGPSKRKVVVMRKAASSCRAPRAVAQEQVPHMPDTNVQQHV